MKSARSLGGEDAGRCRTARSARPRSISSPSRPTPGGEPALLVIFAVIGQEALRHDAEDAAARDGERRNCRAGRCAAAARRRRSTGAELRARLRRAGRSRLDRVEERVLQEQIVDRVGGDVELGKDDEVDAARVRLAGQRQRLLDVEGDVAGRGERARRGDADEAVAVDRAERRPGFASLAFAIYSISVIISTATSSAATRVAPRPTGAEMLLAVRGYTARARAGEMDQARLVARVGEAGDRRARYWRASAPARPRPWRSRPPSRPRPSPRSAPAGTPSISVLASSL